MHARPPAPLLLHVTLEQENNGRVTLGSFLELLQGDLVIFVLVHLGEDLVNALLGGQPILVHSHHDDGAHHLIDSLKSEGKRRKGGLI